MFWRLIYILPNFCAGFGMLVIAWLVWQHRSMRGGLAFFAMALTASLWAFTEGLSFVGLHAEAIHRIWQIQYLGVVSTPVLLSVFALQYVGFGRWLTPAVLAAVGLFPLAVFVAVWVNDGVPWVWARLSWDLTTPFPTLASYHGPLVWLLLAYDYALLAGVGGVLFFRRLSQPLPQRRQINLLLWTGAIPMLASAVYMARIVPLRNMDLAPLAFNISMLVLAWGVLRERIFSLVPMARHEVYQSLDDAVFVLDPQHAVVDLNPAAIRLFGFDPRKVNRVPLIDLIPAAQGLLSRGRGEVVIRIDGHWFDVHLSTLYSQEKIAVGFLLVWRDVTRFKALEAELTRLATIDSLTGLMNHRQFCDSAEQLLAQARRHQRALSLFMLDLDHFKQINDGYGHQQGDAVLIAVAEVCRLVLRASDVVGRLGGEEFAVLLPDTPEPAAQEVANRLLQAIRQLQFSGDLRISASIGIACLDKSGQSFDVLLGQADAALYRAKAQGRDRAVLAEAV
jgi:diguanylate cyclase (GGDEF)-like protein/PAS domain S-box-containing protein